MATDVVGEAASVPTNVTPTEFGGVNPSTVAKVEEPRPANIGTSVSPEAQKAWQNGASLENGTVAETTPLDNSNPGIDLGTKPSAELFERKAGDFSSFAQAAKDVASISAAAIPTQEAVAPVVPNATLENAGAAATVTPDASTTQKPQTAEEIIAAAEAKLNEIRAKKNPTPTPPTPGESATIIRPETQKAVSDYNNFPKISK